MGKWRGLPIVAVVALVLLILYFTELLFIQHDQTKVKAGRVTVSIRDSLVLSDDDFYSLLFYQLIRKYDYFLNDLFRDNVFVEWLLENSEEFLLEFINDQEFPDEGMFLPDVFPMTRVLSFDFYWLKKPVAMAVDVPNPPDSLHWGSWLSEWLDNFKEALRESNSPLDRLFEHLWSEKFRDWQDTFTGRERQVWNKFRKHGYGSLDQNELKVFNAVQARYRETVENFLKQRQEYRRALSKQVNIRRHHDPKFAQRLRDNAKRYHEKKMREGDADYRKKRSGDAVRYREERIAKDPEYAKRVREADNLRKKIEVRRGIIDNEIELTDIDGKKVDLKKALSEADKVTETGIAGYQKQLKILEEAILRNKVPFGGKLTTVLKNMIRGGLGCVKGGLKGLLQGGLEPSNETRNIWGLNFRILEAGNRCDGYEPSAEFLDPGFTGAKKQSREVIEEELKKIKNACLQIYNELISDEGSLLRWSFVDLIGSLYPELKEEIEKQKDELERQR